MIETSATTEIIDFIAHENPQKVMEFKVSHLTKQRVFSLIEASKNGELPQEEQKELEQYLLLEHLMRMAKIKAYQLLHGK
ncbi:hypothetical protein [Phaeodactylibacter sp.]|jgi:hypothetical protein|uniref:hypothetical protein n=1 Tax=Phaeodactylibacter sp. TaxID=1940289 RepID=UPI0025D60953|nr:hypothetical protein [Phaeodactylibacter sp.]MCI4646797.1 hypothetical protein [Phaeodactylibacter sp.]MCI5091728.1 hypothetical protein [Phaeodactylibacter sp.]